ncbi:MAG: HD domain-containing protein [Candidatus Aminicenantes bacterium]|nr:MAG: HD domain-containing protein [Candidatus Aminicenantes bacterium]
MSLFNNFDNKKPGSARREDRRAQKQEKKYIKDLQVGEKVDGYFKVFGISKRARKDGSPFLSLEVMDKTGKMPAKIWDNAERYFNILREGEIYKINGYVNEYMNQKEVKVDGLRAISPSDKDVDKNDFVEEAAFDTGKLFREMIDTLKSNISSSYLLQLVDLFSREYEEKFKSHYGAQKVHHAYIGGLLQHTRSMMRLAIFCADHYSLDKELLLMGVLFHDVGKMFEFSVAPTVETTFEGGLLGHLIIGNNMFLELKNKIPGFPEELSVKVQHLIISHHGEKEFGSPEVPKIPEAFVLHILDLLDSKLKIFEETVSSSETKGLFSDYVKVLGRRLYVPPKGQ